MSEKNTPSLYPYFAASFIEASEHGGTVEAIRFLTQESLKWLRDAHERKVSLEAIMTEVRKKEVAILSKLNGLDPDGGSLTYPLSKVTKMMMWPIRDGLIFLFGQRNGKVSGDGFKEILMSEKDEPYDFVLFYETRGGHFFIKWLILREHPKDGDGDEGEISSREGTVLA